MKGLFIPEITAEMFQNGCLESIEAIMAEGEIYDIDYEPEQPWIPCSKRLPKEGKAVIVNVTIGDKIYDVSLMLIDEVAEAYEEGWINAWMPLPKSYKEEKND